ncbi:hypothetical protein [Devosia sp.]|uniref:hypothetical protein n=1 Tax=Devosia sp. TaxID=1871048 RepID=UPI003A91A805
MIKNTPEKRLPTHSIFQVIGEGDNARWIRVGAGWSHRKDGKGMNLVFDAYPVVGRIVVREVPPAEPSGNAATN